MDNKYPYIRDSNSIFYCITFNTDTDGYKLYKKIMAFHEICNFLVEVFISNHLANYIKVLDNKCQTLDY